MGFRNGSELLDWNWLAKLIAFRLILTREVITSDLVECFGRFPLVTNFLSARVEGITLGGSRRKTFVSPVIPTDFATGSCERRLEGALPLSSISKKEVLFCISFRTAAVPLIKKPFSSTMNPLLWGLTLLWLLGFRPLWCTGFFVISWGATTFLFCDRWKLAFVVPLSSRRAIGVRRDDPKEYSIFLGMLTEFSSETELRARAEKAETSVRSSNRILEKISLSS